MALRCLRQTPVKLENMDVFLTQIGPLGWADDAVYGKNRSSSPDDYGSLANAKGEKPLQNLPLSDFDAVFDEIWQPSTISNDVSAFGQSLDFSTSPLHEDILYRGPNQSAYDESAVVPGEFDDNGWQNDILLHDLLASFCDGEVKKCGSGSIKTNDDFIAFPVEYQAVSPASTECGSTVTPSLAEDPSLDWLLTFLDGTKYTKDEIPQNVTEKPVPMEVCVAESCSPSPIPVSIPVASKIGKSRPSSMYKSTLTTVVPKPAIRRTASRCTKKSYSRPGVRMTQRKREQNQKAAATYRVKKRSLEEEQMREHQILLQQKDALVAEKTDLVKNIENAMRLIERRMGKMKG